MRASLVLLGTLAYFTYLYGTYSLKVAYNELFLVYVALFGLSLYAFVSLFGAFNSGRIAPRFSADTPRRLPAWFMFATGIVAGAIWLEAPIRSLVTGETPSPLMGSTTLITHALDLAIVVPAAVLAGYKILRGESIGYLIAFSLLVLEAMLLPLLALQTVFQLNAGVTIPPEAIIGVFAGFTVLSVGAIWVLELLLRSITEVDSHSRSGLPASGPTRPRRI
jgi:hypothetical protein